MEDELVDIGLSKNEARAYLSIAELGLTSIGNIAKHSKIHRTNVYDAVEGLLKKGVVSYILKDNVKYYQMTDPTNILNVLKEKEDKIKNILPKLLLLSQLNTPQSKAQILEGIPAAKMAMENFLSYGKTIKVMGVTSGVSGLLGSFLTQFHKKRIAKKIVMKHIYNSDAHERIKYLRNLAYTEVKVLPSDYDSPVATNIVGDEVTLIFWDKHPIVIRIVSSSIAKAYSKYFDILWKDAKS